MASASPSSRTRRDSSADSWTARSAEQRAAHPIISDSPETTKLEEALTSLHAVLMHDFISELAEATYEHFTDAPWMPSQKCRDEVKEVISRWAEREKEAQSQYWPIYQLKDSKWEKRDKPEEED